MKRFRKPVSQHLGDLQYWVINSGTGSFVVKAYGDPASARRLAAWLLKYADWCEQKRGKK